MYDKLSNSLDGYDSDTLNVLNKKIETSAEDAKNYAVKYVEKRLKEVDVDMEKKIEKNDMGVKSQIAENASMM